MHVLTQPNVVVVVVGFVGVVCFLKKRFDNLTEHK